MARHVTGDGLARVVENFLPVHAENGVLGDEIAHFFAKAQRMNRVGIAGQLGFGSRSLGLLDSLKLRAPAGEVVEPNAPMCSLAQLPENGARIAH